jgi:hypothetical protein
MSSERVPPGAAPDGPPPTGSGPGVRGFRRTVGVVVAALLLLVAGLTAANSAQGPRLVRAELDLGASVERSGQRLLLQLDQASTVVPDQQVVVEPAVPVAVEVERSVVSVQFREVLRHDTTYQVTLPLVSGVTGTRSALRHTFTTPPVSLYVLRTPDSSAEAAAPVVVERVTAGEPRPEPVLEEPGLQEFAVAEPHLGVLTAVEDGTTALAVRPLDGSTPAQVVATGYLSQLRSSGPAGVLGYLRTDQVEGAELNPVHLQLVRPGSGAEPTTALGLDGEPIQVVDWLFVPGTSAVVVQDAESTLFLVDPLGDQPVQALGTHAQLRGFGRGAVLVVEDGEAEYTRVDLAAGRAARVPDVDVGDGLLTAVLPLAAPDRYVGIRVGSGPDADAGSSLVLVEGRQVRTVHTAGPSTSVNELCLSPNAQYAALSLFDDLGGADLSGALRTAVVEIATGEVVVDTPGDAADWCRR